MVTCLAMVWALRISSVGLFALGVTADIGRMTGSYRDPKHPLCPRSVVVQGLGKDVVRINARNAPTPEAINGTIPNSTATCCNQATAVNVGPIPGRVLETHGDVYVIEASFDPFHPRIALHATFYEFNATILWEDGNKWTQLDQNPSAPFDEARKVGPEGADCPVTAMPVLAPTALPTLDPTAPTREPSHAPSHAPSHDPTQSPSRAPTQMLITSSSSVIGSDDKSDSIFPPPHDGNIEVKEASSFTLAKPFIAVILVLVFGAAVVFCLNKKITQLFGSAGDSGGDYEMAGNMRSKIRHEAGI